MHEPAAFRDVSVILPVINETYSLRETVLRILAAARADIREFLIVISDKTTTDSLKEIEGLRLVLGDLLVVHRQRLSFLGGAIREAFDLAQGSHTIMMASDLETDPGLVPLLIAAARRRPGAITTVTRWGQGGAFDDYSLIKLAANWLFQKLFGILYRTSLSDMTYGYRIFPTALVQSIRWEELRHPFLFETLVKPLRLGVDVIEIPGVWRARTEGASQNSFVRNFDYFRVGCRTRFTPPGDILR